MTVTEKDFDSVDIVRYEGTTEDGNFKVFTLKTPSPFINSHVLDIFEAMMFDFPANEVASQILSLLDYGFETQEWHSRKLSTKLLLRLARLFTEASLAPYSTEEVETPTVIKTDKFTTKPN